MTSRRLFDIIGGNAIITTQKEDGFSQTSVYLFPIAKIREHVDGIFASNLDDSIGQIIESDFGRTFEKFDTVGGVATIEPFELEVLLNTIGQIEEEVNKLFDGTIDTVGQIIENVTDAYYFRTKSICVGMINEQITNGVLYIPYKFIKQLIDETVWTKE